MVIIGMISQIDDSRTMIDALMSRLVGGVSSRSTGGHDRLGKRVGHFPRNQEELEEMANARVPDEFIFCRDANTHRVESREARYQPVRKTQLPQWCPEGLTWTQKRKMQRERQEELSRQHGVYVADGVSCTF